MLKGKFGEGPKVLLSLNKNLTASYFISIVI